MFRNILLNVVGMPLLLPLGFAYLAALAVAVFHVLRFFRPRADERAGYDHIRLGQVPKTLQEDPTRFSPR